MSGTTVRLSSTRRIATPFSTPAQVDEEQGQPPQGQPTVALERGHGQEEQDHVEGQGYRRAAAGTQRFAEVVPEERAAAQDQGDRQGGRGRRRGRGERRGRGACAGCRSRGPWAAGQRSRPPCRRAAGRMPSGPFLSPLRARARWASGEVGREAARAAEGLLRAVALSLVEALQPLRDEGEPERARGSRCCARCGGGGSPGRRAGRSPRRRRVRPWRRQPQSASNELTAGADPRTSTTRLGRLGGSEGKGARSRAGARPRRAHLTPRHPGPGHVGHPELVEQVLEDLGLPGGPPALGLVLQHLEDGDDRLRAREAFRAAPPRAARARRGAARLRGASEITKAARSAFGGVAPRRRREVSARRGGRAVARRPDQGRRAGSARVPREADLRA